jgi:Uma2 family endonuclease
MSPSLRQPRHRFSYSEYLVYERDSGLKHEYDDGTILGMAGGSRRHNALAARLVAAIENTRKPGCAVFHCDQRVRVLSPTEQDDGGTISTFRRSRSTCW